MPKVIIREGELTCDICTKLNPNRLRKAIGRGFNANRDEWFNLCKTHFKAAKSSLHQFPENIVELFDEDKGDENE